MSILNVNQLQPVGGGNTITVSASDVNFSGNISIGSSFVGTASTATLATTAILANTATVATNAQGLTGTPDITVNNIQSGVVTATTFIGDGSGITGVTASGSGINIKDSASTVGVAATVDFGTNLNVSPASAGIVTVTVGDTDFAIADKIIHTGDTNTAIRFPADDTFTVETGGDERLRIDSNGKLILKPGADYGNILQLNGADTTSEILELGINATGYAQITATHASGGSNTCGFIFRTRGGAGGTNEKLRITPTGNVGINSSSPAAILDVRGNSVITGILTATTFKGDGSQLDGVGGDTDITSSLFT